MPPLAYTYYQLLQVDPEASPEVIEAAYRRLAKLYHPDYNASTEAMAHMQELNCGYAVLRDPVQRRVYDQKIAIHRSAAVKRKWFGITITQYNKTVVLGAAAATLCLFAVFSNPTVTKTSTTQDIAPAQTAEAFRIQQAVMATIEALPKSQVAGEAPSRQKGPSDNSTLHANDSIAMARLDTDSTSHSASVTAFESSDQNQLNSTQQLSNQPSIQPMVVRSTIASSEGKPGVSRSLNTAGGSAVAVQKTVGEVLGSQEGKQGNDETVTVLVVTATPLATSTPLPTQTDVVIVTPLEPTVEVAPDTAYEVASNTEAEESEPTASPASISLSTSPTVTPLPVTPLAVTPPTVTPTRQLVNVQSVQQDADITSTTVDTESVSINAQPIQLIAPENNLEGGGPQLFEWRTQLIAETGHGFELVFWRPKDDPLTESFGLTAPITGNSVRINLDDLDDSLGDFFNSGEYRWGVLYVQTVPTYERIQMLSEGRTYYFTNFGTNRRTNTGGVSPASGE